MPMELSQKDKNSSPAGVLQRFQGRSCLVTGGAGFIGSNLVLELVSTGAKVTVLDNLVEACGGNRFNLEAVSSDIQFWEEDQLNLSSRQERVRGFDFIFNLAGNVSHQDSMDRPLFDLEANGTAHLALLEACRRENPKAVIVFSSTRQLYGVPRYLPVDEKHPIQPTDINGIHKFTAEEYHRLYHQVHGLQTVSLRLTNTFGPHQLVRHARQGFIGWFMNRCLLGEEIQLFGGGGQLRDFNYVSDVVNAMLLAALNPTCAGKAFNLSGERKSLKEIAAYLRELSPKLQIREIEFPAERKKIDIGNYYGDSQLFEKETGWKPLVSVEKGLERTYVFYEKYLSHYL